VGDVTGATNRPLVSHSQQKPCLHVSRMAAAIGGAILLITSAAPASAEPTVTELRLTDVSIQRVLHASPAHPGAALIMLPGGKGMVEFGPDAGLR
jgi:hypothetical protein